MCVCVDVCASDDQQGPVWIPGSTGHAERAEQAAGYEPAHGARPPERPGRVWLGYTLYDAVFFKRYGLNQVSLPLSFSQQVEEVASLLIAVRNLGGQCYLNTYGPLEEMDLLRMMDMVKVRTHRQRLINTVFISTVNFFFHFFMIIHLFDFIVVSGIHTRDERHREESNKTDGA